MANDSSDQPVIEGASDQDEQQVGAVEEAASDSGDEAEQDAEADAGEDQELSDSDTEELQANEVAFDWQASEYVQHHKGATWYIAMVAIVVLLVAIAALLQYWLEVAAFIAMGGAILVYAKRAPRTLTYELTGDGITVDGVMFPFTGFRSFGVVSDIEWHTIDLVPTKRLSPRMAILFDDADFDTIIGHLELHLPRVDRDPDVVERLTKILRF
jgi:hypothetical protein